MPTSDDILRIAAVQLNYQAIGRTGEFWRLDEPLMAADPFVPISKSDYLLKQLEKSHASLAHLCPEMAAFSRQEYIANLERKLKEILTFCYGHKVNVVVFPEYSIPPLLVGVSLHFFS